MTLNKKRKKIQHQGQNIKSFMVEPTATSLMIALISALTHFFQSKISTHTFQTKGDHSITWLTDSASTLQNMHWIFSMTWMTPILCKKVVVFGLCLQPSHTKDLTLGVNTLCQIISEITPKSLGCKMFHYLQTDETLKHPEFSTLQLKASSLSTLRSQAMFNIVTIRTTSSFSQSLSPLLKHSSHSGRLLINSRACLTDFYLSDEIL